LNRIQWQNNDIWHDGNADAKIDSHLNQSNPTSGHVLSWTGTEYAWVAQSGGGSGTPGGSNTQVQYNNNGSFGGDSTFTFDSATNTLTVQNLTVTGSGATNTISSSSDVVLDAGNRVSVQGAVPFRLPNVTTTQRNAIAGATGDMVFNTTTSAVEVYNGTAWVAL
jgi:hypothetical protein